MPAATETATATPIHHLVVIFQANVSFDHYFGTYPNAANIDGQPFIAQPGTPAVNGLSPELLLRNPNSMQPVRLGGPGQQVTCDHGEYSNEQKAFNGGAMDRFVENTEGNNCDPTSFNPPGLVMDYYDGNTVTALWNYAQRYAMSLFSLQQIDVQCGNGSIRTFERWKERWPHSVIMVAVTEAQEVLLVSEFVAGLGRRVLRLPSGRVEDGESPASAARRELCEEEGFDSGRHRIIHRFYNEPGHSDAFTDVALLTDLRPGHLTGDEPEALTQVAWPLQEIRALIEQSVVSDVRTIAALYLAEVVLRGSA